MLCSIACSGRSGHSGRSIWTMATSLALAIPIDDEGTGTSSSCHAHLDDDGHVLPWAFLDTHAAASDSVGSSYSLSSRPFHPDTLVVASDLVGSSYTLSSGPFRLSGHSIWTIATGLTLAIAIADGGTGELIMPVCNEC